MVWLTLASLNLVLACARGLSTEQFPLASKQRLDSAQDSMELQVDIDTQGFCKQAPLARGSTITYST
jgi:hypothetical protein